MKPWNHFRCLQCQVTFKMLDDFPTVEICSEECAREFIAEMDAVTHVE